MRWAELIAWTCEHEQRAESRGGLVVEVKVAVLSKLGLSPSREKRPGKGLAWEEKDTQRPCMVSSRKAFSASCPKQTTTQYEATIPTLMLV